LQKQQGRAGAVAGLATWRHGSGRVHGAGCGPGRGGGPPVHGGPGPGRRAAWAGSTVDRPRGAAGRGPRWTARGAGRGGRAARRCAVAPLPALRRLAVAALCGAGRRAKSTGEMRTARRARCARQQRLGEAGVRCSRGGGDGGLRRAWTRGRRGRGSVLRPSTCSSRGGETRACLTSAREVAEREADGGNGARQLRRRRCELRRRLCGSELQLGFRGGADECGGL
jgi:hypothetical protein